MDALSVLIICIMTYAIVERYLEYKERKDNKGGE